jgi:hypothetical protein
MKCILAFAAATALFFVVLPFGLSAHEVPSAVRVQVFLKPEAQTARLLVRVPLASINDVDWPERASGFLDLSREDSALREAVDSSVVDFIALYEGDRRLPAPRIAAVRASLPSDQSFDSYDQAIQSITGPPLPDDAEFVTAQGMLDALLEYPIESPASDFSIRPDFKHFGVEVLTVLRFLPPGNAERALTLHDDPGIIRLDPSWMQAVWIFVKEGFFHILDGIDHLLFLLCLVIPFRRFRTLFPVVTAFTIAHSITLIASAYDMAPTAGWFPPLVETLIAASIVYMALENIVSPGLRRRWAIAFGFGLIHGFGFSFALRETLQFAGAHLFTSLLSFNLGVELGQVLVLLLAIPALDLLFRYGMAERVGTIVMSALIAHTGWHWMTDRGSQALLYPFEWPVVDAAFYLNVVRWAILLVVTGAVAWVIFGLLGQGRRRVDIQQTRRSA